MPFLFLSLSVCLLASAISAQFFPTSIFPSGGNNLQSVPSLFPVLGSNNNDGSRPAPNSGESSWPFQQPLPQQPLQETIQQPLQQTLQQPLQNWQQQIAAPSSPTAPNTPEHWQSQQPLYSAKPESLQRQQHQPQYPWQQTSPFYNQRQPYNNVPQQQYQQGYPYPYQRDGYNINNNPFYGFNNFFNNPNWPNSQQQQQQQQPPPQQNVESPKDPEPSSYQQPQQGPSLLTQPSPFQTSLLNHQPSLFQSIQKPQSPIEAQQQQQPQQEDKNSFPFGGKPVSQLGQLDSRPISNIQSPLSPQLPESPPIENQPLSSSINNNPSSSPAAPQKPFQQGQWIPSTNGLNIAAPQSPQTPSMGSIFEDEKYKPQVYGDGVNPHYLYNNTGQSQMTHQQEQIQNSMNNLNFDTRLNDHGDGEKLDTPPVQTAAPTPEEKNDGSAHSAHKLPLAQVPAGNPSYSFDHPTEWVYPDDR